MVPPAQSYDERLTAPRSWWAIAALVGVATALTLMPFGGPAMLGGLVGAGAVACVLVSSYGSVRIRIVADSLVAGDARVPLSALGGATVLDREEAFAWRTHKADARAHMLLRSYVPTAVRIEITDPQDPTPYLYLSTRSPRRLVAALEKARGGTGETAAATGSARA